MRIELDDDEKGRLAHMGLDRTLNAMKKKRKGAHGFDRGHERWGIDIEGVLAEAAAAKALGLPYHPVVGKLDTKLGDIGPGLQVRSTRYPTGSLLIHPSDADEDRFILVTGQEGAYDVRGWIYARDGKVDKLWKNYKGRGSYWVGQNWLQPLSTLVLPHAET